MLGFVGLCWLVLCPECGWGNRFSFAFFLSQWSSTWDLITQDRLLSQSTNLEKSQTWFDKPRERQLGDSREGPEPPFSPKIWVC